MSKFVTVAKVGEIPQGEGRAFEIEEKIVAVFNDGGTYRAIDDMCPHMGASLAAGFMEDSCVACPWHGWRFDTRDGAWVENRRLKIDVFEVRVEGEEIQVLVPEPEKTNEKSDTSEDTEGTSGEDKGCEACSPPESDSKIESDDENGKERFEI